MQTASPVCGTKNFSSVRLYSAPQLHCTIVAIQTNMRFGLSIFQPGTYAHCHEPLRPTFAGPSNARAAVERAAYDEPLKDVDLLLMPTLPLKATLLPARDASREDYVARALEMIFNTCPFDVTGHPAATVPAGMSAGLPCWHDADRTPLGGRHGVACSGRVPDSRIDGSRELPANGNAGVQGSETGGRALSDASLCRLGSDPSTTLPHITADEHEG